LRSARHDTRQRSPVRGARPLVYVSVWNLTEGRYYFECETPTGPEATDYKVVEKGEDVDFETLKASMERHLGKGP
jgi:hypothetical protein